MQSIYTLELSPFVQDQCSRCPLPFGKKREGRRHAPSDFEARINTVRRLIQVIVFDNSGQSYWRVVHVLSNVFPESWPDPPVFFIYFSKFCTFLKKCLKNIQNLRNICKISLKTWLFSKKSEKSSTRCSKKLYVFVCFKAGFGNLVGFVVRFYESLRKYSFKI